MRRFARSTPSKKSNKKNAHGQTTTPRGLPSAKKMIHMPLRVKLHDVQHNRRDDAVALSRLEDRMKETTIDNAVADVRIAPGPQNSPIFITIDDTRITIDRVKKIARPMLKTFDSTVGGVDIDRVLRDDNIKISAVDE